MKVFWFAAPFALACFSTTSAPAAEPTKQECVATSEKAQLLRGEGKLRASMKEFQKCSSDSCPAAVHADCAEQFQAVVQDLPTVTFSSPESVRPLQVSMDGEPLEEQVDGAYVVEPGNHSFSFAADGVTTLSKQLTIRIGEKGRRERVSFKSNAEPASHPAPKGATTQSAPFHDLGFAGVGAGALGLTTGIILGIVAKTTYDGAQSHCHAGHCDVEGVSGGRSADAFAAAGTAGFISGAVLLASGIALLLFGPNSAPATVGKAGGLSW